MLFYTIRGGVICEEPFGAAAEGVSGFGYLGAEELRGMAGALGMEPEVAEELLRGGEEFRTGVDVYDAYSLITVSAVQPADVLAPRDRLALLVQKGRFFVINVRDEDSSTVNALKASVSRFRQSATLEKVIYGALESLLEGGSRYAEQTERFVMQTERQVIAGEIEREFNAEIYELRNRTSILRNYYEQLVEVGGELEENSNDLFAEEELRYFNLFTDKASRLSANMQALGENLIHLREALDAALNYSMTVSMRVFTAVSAIFLPLTLIAGWYGMNFKHMPELGWELGYPFVAALSAVIAAGCILYFKRRKWL